MLNKSTQDLYSCRPSAPGRAARAPSEIGPRQVAGHERGPMDRVPERSLRDDHAVSEEVVGDPGDRRRGGKRPLHFDREGRPR